MAGVLIRMKIAILRHAWRGGQSSMLWSGATLGVLLAIGTMSAVVSAPIGQAIDTLAIAFGLWAVGWMMLPLIGGSGGDPLRPEVFRLTTIPPRRLAVGLLIAGGVGVLPLVSVLAFGSLVVVAARLDLLTVIVAIVGVALTLALVIALSRVVVGALGRAMETRLGLELAAIQYALILGFSLFWIPLIVLSNDGAGGAPGSGNVGPGVGEFARILPSGWAAVAVEAAGRSDWGVTIAALGGLIVLIGLLTLAWTALVARRLELSPGTRRRTRRPLASAADRPSGTRHPGRRTPERCRRARTPDVGPASAPRTRASGRDLERDPARGRAGPPRVDGPLAMGRGDRRRDRRERPRERLRDGRHLVLADPLDSGIGTGRRSRAPARLARGRRDDGDRGQHRAHDREWPPRGDAVGRRRHPGAARWSRRAGDPPCGDHAGPAARTSRWRSSRPGR